jgi:hypothetical protein
MEDNRQLRSGCVNESKEGRDEGISEKLFLSVRQKFVRIENYPTFAFHGEISAKAP